MNHPPTSLTASTVLRICLILEWAFVTLGVALSFWLESRLPEPLQDWLIADAEADSTVLELVQIVFLFPLLLGSLVGSIGLFFLKRWAAWLYLLSLILSYLLFPFMGPTVIHALADTVDEIGILISGLIIGLAFFSDALRAPPAQVSPPPLS